MAYRKAAGELAGIGFVFTDDDPFVGVDVDDVIDDDGNLATSATEIVAHFRTTYVEVSPSGRGLKIILIGRKPDDRCRVGGTEVYASGRYFALTGMRWPETGADVCDCQEGLDWLCEARLAAAQQPSHPHNLASGGSNGSDYSAGSVTVEEVIAGTLPKKPRQRNHCIMALARGLKFDAGLGGQTLPQLKPIVREWHRQALPNIRTKDFDSTWAEFVRAWGRAKIPLSGALSAVFELAKTRDVPEAQGYELPGLRRLIALCRELADPKGRFFLSSHAAAPLLGEDPMTVYRWLNVLAADELLEVITKGNEHQATRYRWRGAL